MDKFFLLTYVSIGQDGFLHSRHAWFETEEELRSFARSARDMDAEMEIELAIEIYGHREIGIHL
ncbi:MAG TPA: hypothetical protein IAB84_11305 [Candidatus Choladousia intestinigallinarum]|nr:hypothetical protein [Candidatus Choladousia intestinigallinarum]